MKSRPKLHMAITNNMTFTLDRLNELANTNWIIHMISRTEALTKTDTLIRITSIGSEVRGYRPVSYQFILPERMTNKEKDTVRMFRQHIGSDAMEIEVLKST